MLLQYHQPVLTFLIHDFKRFSSVRNDKKFVHSANQGLSVQGTVFWLKNESYISEFPYYIGKCHQMYKRIESKDSANTFSKLLAYFLFPLQISCKFNASPRPYLLQQNIFTPGITVSQVPCTLPLRNLKTRQSSVLLDSGGVACFGFVFQEYSGRELTGLTSRYRLEKDPFSKCFPSMSKSELV